MDINLSCPYPVPPDAYRINHFCQQFLGGLTVSSLMPNPSVSWKKRETDRSFERGLSPVTSTTLAFLCRNHTHLCL